MVVVIFCNNFNIYKHVNTTTTSKSTIQNESSEKMKILIRESSIVIPAEKSPRKKLWITSLDLITPPIHTQIMHFYRHNGAANFFDTKVLKNALSRILVAFYLVGGRLKEDKDGRIEIDCHGQGALFVAAESDSVVDDLGVFAPTPELQKLIPAIDYSLPIETNPLLIFQVTYFKCGGVSLGYGMHHYVADGLSQIEFLKMWSDMARGLDLTVPPIIDRTVLCARDPPPQPVFKHSEFQFTPMKSSMVSSQDETEVSIFKLTRDQINMLKAKTKEDGNTSNYSSFEMLAAHVWKCVCRARGLRDDEETKIYFPTDGRTRLHPTLPPGYFGNAAFLSCALAVAGNIQSHPSWYGTSKIHSALVKMSNDYLKSTIDHLELQTDSRAVAVGLAQSYKGTNLGITSWARLGLYDIDFGWGRPIYAGPGDVGMEGLTIVLPNPSTDRSLSILIKLQVEHMKLFKKFFYEFCLTKPSWIEFKTLISNVN